MNSYYEKLCMSSLSVPSIEFLGLSAGISQLTGWPIVSSQHSVLIPVLGNRAAAPLLLITLLSLSVADGTISNMHEETCTPRADKFEWLHLQGLEFCAVSRDNSH